MFDNIEKSSREIKPSMINSGNSFPIIVTKSCFNELYRAVRSNLDNYRVSKKAEKFFTAKDSFDLSRTTAGFSIKSHLGSSSTLFNCSSTSGFTYKVVGCDEQAMHTLNNLDSLLVIINRIKQDYSLNYIGCKNPVFMDNIGIVDSQMDKVLSTMVLVNVGYLGDDRSNDMLNTCAEVTRINPLGVRNPQSFYPAKFREFLFDAFAGMTATTAWNARKKLTGGYIDVNRDGEMLYYRAISDDVFGNFLLHNTYIDRPDRGYPFELALESAHAYLKGRSLSEDEINSVLFDIDEQGRRKKKAKKGDYGFVYCLDGEYYIDLNFSVRFR